MHFRIIGHIQNYKVHKDFYPLHIYKYVTFDNEHMIKHFII